MQPLPSTEAQLKKAEMRRHILADLKSMSEGTRQSASLKIQNQLQQTLSNSTGFWGAYQALPATEPTLSWSDISKNIKWCFPLIENGEMKFKKSSQTFQKSQFGFSEPIDGDVIEIEQIEGVIVPGLGFDQDGYRLGRGRGYYDKTLKNYKGRTIGVCFQHAFKNTVPHEEHDLKCQTIITEEQSVVIQGVHEWN